MKIKVLFLIESLAGGGAEKVLSVILSHLDNKRFEIRVCAIVDAGVHREAVRACVARYTSIINYNGGTVGRTFNRLKYKLVYSLLPPSWVYRLFVPKNNDVEVAFCEGFVTKLLSHANSKARQLAWVHTDLAAHPWPLKQGIYRNKEEERLVYQRFDKVVCVSRAVEDVMQKDYGLTNTTVIHNPVDAEEISALSREECPVPLDSSCFNIVAVGRLVPEKGFDELVRITADMTARQSNVHLYIIGDGPERTRLEEMIEAGQSRMSIHLTGYRANPYALMSRADLYVCSSHAEGFSLTIAEAMVLGVPIISMNCAGPAELLEKGRFGALCNTYNDLSDTLRKAVTNKAFLANLRNQSKEGKNRFYSDVPLKRIEALLETV